VYLYVAAMSKCIALVLLLLSAAPTLARNKAETWTEVRSPHFVVVTNSNEKQGLRVADQFERMREVFHAAFPKLQIDPGSPIIVLAIKDEKDFKALEPEAYLARGSLQLGGLFLRAPDKNYVLMRLDAEGEHPYAIVYHEYTHLLVGKAAEWMPLWMNEGLAEFYQNTEIRDKDALLGEPSRDDIMLLRQTRLLPLATLFTVDQKSPYYHEENKGSIFYAESWALTHYIEVKDHQDKGSRLLQYSDLLIQKVDPVTAATRAFGDLKQLQSALEIYIQQASFSYFKMATTTDVDDSAFKVEVMTEPQADAVRADFLAYNQRTADAHALIDHVLQEDPKNVQAQETLGFMEFQQHHLDEARQHYAQAVQLDSQSYLAHYYFAAISMMSPVAPSDEEQIESSLRASIKLNPSFAPSYDRLAAFLGSRRRNLEDARMMGLTAVSLDPGNAGYRINEANVLLAMGQGENAIKVLDNAAKLAKSPEETQTIDILLMSAKEYVAAQQRNATLRQEISEEEADQVETDLSADVPRLARKTTFVPSGPHRFLVGVLKNVHCHNPNLDLAVTSGGKMLTLHSDNYFKIQFSALGFQPNGDLNPCRDLENRSAKVEYVESADKSDAPHLLAVELHK
jgi:tetratricopeptide (TPR) repeat protein